MTTKHFPKGLDGRMRDQSGEIHKKRGDTRVATLRKTYGDDFAKGYRSDARLDTVLQREKLGSLDQLLKKKNDELPMRNLKTGSYTTTTSSAAISTNVLKFTSALKELAKK